MRNNAALLRRAMRRCADCRRCRRRPTGIDKQDFKQIERGRYLADRRRLRRLPHPAGQRSRVRRRRAHRNAVRQLIGAEHHARSGRPASAPGPTTSSSTRSQNGTGRDGKRLYPAMPYTYYTKMTRDDALAIRAYLEHGAAGAQSGRAKPAAVPVRHPRDDDGVERAVLHARDISARSEQERGMESRRLSGRGLGHCGMCHTPKNMLGGDENGQALQGYALQGWFAPDITNDPRRGLGSWSVDEIVSLSQDRAQQHAAATGLMAEMVNWSTSHLSDADLRAIAAYLKDQPGNGTAGDTANRDQAGRKNDEDRRRRSMPTSAPAVTLRTERELPVCFHRSTVRRLSSRAIRPRCCMSCCGARAAPPPTARRPHRRCRNSPGC